jgi:hypothetical protein
MTELIKPNGCIPSPPDGRDVLASQVSPIPKRIPEIFLPLFDLDVLDQKQEPACVGFTCAVIKQEKELRERITEMFDGSWIYKKCKEIDNWNGQGTYLRTGLKILQKLGAKPLNGKETDAYQYRIGGYARVDDLSFEGLKKAIAVNGTAMAGFTGSNAGWQSAYIRKPKESETTWGHAVALVGYNKDYLIGQNSWGSKWGDNGLFYVPKDYLPFESWETLVDLPTSCLALEDNEGFIALNSGWASGNKTLVNLNFRNEPKLGNNLIKTLSKGTNIEIKEYAGYSDNYHWLRIQVL